MENRRKPHMVQHLYGAGLRLATDEAPDARVERRRMLVALEATQALERAISEGVVAVRFAALRDEEADPLDLEVELSIGRRGHEDADVCPAFTFNLRDAYVAGTRDGADAASVDRIARILPAFEALVAQMRRNARGVYRTSHRAEGELAEMEN
jgi:hypothetical protein